MSKLCRIFLIDDDHLEHDLWNLMVQIKKLPVALTCYTDAHMALKDLRQMPKDQFPHVIVTDIQMPTMDGFEVADIFMEEFHLKFPATIFCMYSSTIRLSDIERAKNHKLISSFIEKPINKEKIEEHILNYYC